MEDNMNEVAQEIIADHNSMPQEETTENLELQKPKSRRENKKNVLAVLDLEEQSELISQYELLISIGRFTPPEILELGIEAALKTDRFLAKAQNMKEILDITKQVD